MNKINYLIRTGAAVFLLSLPRLSHASVYTWNVGNGDAATASNWSPTATFSSSNSDQYDDSNGSALTLTSTLNIKSSNFYLGAQSGGAGGSLTVGSGGTLYASTLQTDSTSGLSGTSSIEIQSGGTGSTTATDVGKFNTASMTVDSGATFYAGSLYIGVYGPTYVSSGTVNPQDKGVGTFTNYGTTTGGIVYLGQNGATGTFINQGGTGTFSQINTANTSPTYNSPATLEIVGHTGSISLTGGSASVPGLLADTSATTIEWVFDSTGIAPINVTKSGVGANISNATLDFNLGSAKNGTYILVATNGGTITDSFGTSENVTSNLGPASTTTGLLFVSGGDLEITVTTATLATQAFSSPSPATLRIMTGASTAVTATLSNTAASGANALNIALSDSSTGGTGHGSVTSLTPASGTVAAGAHTTVSGTYTAGTAGVATWGITNTDNSASNTTASTTGSVTVYSKSASGLSQSSANFGVVHAGDTVASETTALQNTGSGTYAAGLQITGLGGLTGATAGTGTASGATIIAASGSVTLSAAVSTASTGTYNQSYSITSTDDQSITGFSSDTTQTYTVTGWVYSGTGTWTNGTGSWGAISAAPAHWQAVGGTPGLDSNDTSSDSATFDTTGDGGAPVTVSLNGDSPSLKAVTFNDSAESYTIAQGSGGMLKLNGTSGTGTATVADSAGNHTISAPVEFDSNVAASAASSSTLTLSGNITQSGTRSLAISGPGQIILTGSNTYGGGTTVNSGSLIIANGSGSALGSGALTVAAGATFGGSGSATGLSSFSVGSGSSTRAQVQVGSGGSNINTNLTLAATTGSITTANLTFNLSSSSVAGNELNLGSTAVNFNNTTLTLNLIGTSIIAANTPYVLITDSAGFNPATDGLTITNGVITGGLSIASNQFFGTPNANGFSTGFYNGSYLFVSGNNIDVEVVPEPGTWAMMIGGLGLLIMIQRRRNKQR